jgi:acetyl/propionyl-CoA carboxylase alpha subunit
VVPGFDGKNASFEEFRAAAEQIGYPVLVKASAGGGGRGMRRVNHPDELPAALDSARREALAGFGDDALLLEKLVERPRHIEVQIVGDAHGNLAHLYERECSIQRRHQKIIEEAPSPAVDAALRERLGDAAVRVARAAGYTNAGTVEFLLAEDGAFYLLEMNARLQVEHPVTEAITGLDLVAVQIAVAEGRPLPFRSGEVPLRGHAIEVRLCAEDPNRDFLPATGPLVRFELGDQVRVDTGFESGGAVGIHYDSMLAKLIAWGPDRATATRKLHRAVERAWVPGVVTNLPLLREILAHPAWETGALDTGFLARHGLPTPPPLHLERGAIAATVQGWALRRAAHHLRGETPADIPANWRIGGPAVAAESWQCGASTVEVRYRALGGHALEVEVAGARRRVELLEHRGDSLRVEIDGTVQTWRVAGTHDGPPGDGDLRYVHLGDGEAFVQRVPRFPPPVREVEPGQCIAPTPGKVVSVAVAVGDAVRAGQTLVVLEAMKMEHRLLAPQEGVVTQVRVAPGETVEQGALLVRVGPADGTAAS